MIVLDASVLIGHLDAADAHHAAAEALLLGAVDDELAVNPLTLAEVLVGPIRAGRLHTVLDLLRELDVQELPFPPRTAVRLAELRAVTSLRMPDCCVLLSAEDARAHLATFDDGLTRAARQRGVAVHPR